MRRDAEQALTLTLTLTLVWLFSWIPYSMCHSPPGKPKLMRCRSPEKETFTCWWEPGSTGGLPTSYHLYYRKETSVEVFECPDYHTAGDNSCYFDKRHTSIWIIYNITVVASNALGKTFSESVEVDVMDIVQPHPPENVTVSLVQTENSPQVLVQWQPPRDADTRSGWVTIKYEIRIKMENSRDETNSMWESYSAGKQLEFSIYSPRPAACYLIQVRCKLDQGLWSEWSRPASIQIPDKPSETQSAVMILVVTLTVFIFSLTAGVLVLKMKRVKHVLLPPVPQPKINGLDNQLLKRGRSEEIFRALITQYPQIAQTSECQVKYLVVSDIDEEIEFDGKALLKYSDILMGENCSTEAAQTFPQNTETSIQETNTTESEGLSSPDPFNDPGHDSQDYRHEASLTVIHPGTIFNQLPGSSTTEHLLAGPQPQLHLDCSGALIKAQDQKSGNPHLRPSTKDEIDHSEVQLVPAELIGYVEVDKEKQGQEPLTAEDYSKISDILSDNILVLRKDSSPVRGHKHSRCDKTCDVTEGVPEPVGYLETDTIFSSES